MTKTFENFQDSKSTKASSSKATNAESNELTYEQVLYSAHSSRREAEREFSLRNENFNKAATAHRNGNPAVASYYSEMVTITFSLIQFFYFSKTKCEIEKQGK